MSTQQHILVIKLSAFGDFILALGAFERIRAAHPHARLSLMTTRPFKELAENSGYFDEILLISRWRATEAAKWLRYVVHTWQRPFDMVYDLQNNDRTRILRLLSPPRMRNNWASLKRSRPEMVDIATFAGTPPTSLNWLTAGAKDFSLPRPYALLVPGSAPQHPAKRWPAAHYADLAVQLAAAGVTPVVLGTAAEEEVTAVIAQACPQAVDLTAKTSFADIAAMAQGAACAVGNDTGPMHLISLCGCPVVSLFSGASNPAQSAPRGEVVRVLRQDPLAALPVAAVWAETRAVLDMRGLILP